MTREIDLIFSTLAINRNVDSNFQKPFKRGDETPDLRIPRIYAFGSYRPDPCFDPGNPRPRSRTQAPPATAPVPFRLMTDDSTAQVYNSATFARKVPYRFIDPRLDKNSRQSEKLWPDIIPYRMPSFAQRGERRKRKVERLQRWAPNLVSHELKAAQEAFDVMGSPLLERETSFFSPKNKMDSNAM